MEELEKRYDELYEVYNNENIEKNKTKTSKGFHFMLVIMIIVVLLILMILPGAIPIVIIIIPVTIISLKKNKEENKIKSHKEKIIEPLLKELNFVNDVALSENRISKLYKQMNFGDSDYNEIVANKYISSSIKNSNIYFSSVTTYYKDTWTDDDGRTHTKYKTIFDGSVIIGMLDKEIINGYIMVLTDKDDKSFKLKEKEDKVHMDSLDFENMFDVYSTDPIKAMQILTTDFMQKLLYLRKYLNMNYQVSICKNMIAIRISNKDIFNFSGLRYNEDVLKRKTVDDIKFFEYISEFVADRANEIYDKI